MAPKAQSFEFEIAFNAYENVIVIFVLNNFHFNYQILNMLKCFEFNFNGSKITVKNK